MAEDSPWKARALHGADTGVPATEQVNAAPRLACSAKDAAELLGISRAQFWKLHAAGRVPLPVRLGAKAPRWRVDELRTWLAAGCPNRDVWQRMQECEQKSHGL